MQVMPTHSPSRRAATPPAPRISGRSPGTLKSRGRSPDRRRRLPHLSVMMSSGSASPSRGRERREFRHSPRREYFTEEQMMRPRRSRSPLERGPKARSYSPRKRKMSPRRERPRELERERSHASHSSAPPRKRTRSKTPTIGPSRESSSRLGSYGGIGGPGDSTSRSYSGLQGPYQSSGPNNEDHTTRRRESTERFRGSVGRRSYDKDELGRPAFRGPEGVTFDRNELKKITVDIRRNLPLNKIPIERNIINPEDVVLVRRPGEGSRPIFAREEIMQAACERAKYDPEPSPPYESGACSGPTDEHSRLVAIVGDPAPLPSSGGSRYESPSRYGETHSRPRDNYFAGGDREESHPYRRSAGSFEPDHGPPGFQHREKNREHFERRSEDLRHGVEPHRHDDARYSGDGGRYERGLDYRSETGRSSGDLRMRVGEKRTDLHEMRDSHPRMPARRSDSMERERERPYRGMQPPPGRGSMERFGRSPGDGKMRTDGIGGGRNAQHAGPSRRNDAPTRFRQDPSTMGQRSERFNYNKSWDPNPEYVPKGRAYFEHDNRGDEYVRGRGRGSIMSQRGNAGMRGRGGIRGRPYRGGAPSRGYVGRGTRRGYAPRYTGRPRSPHWEHDMFDMLLEDDHEQASNINHGKQHQVLSHTSSVDLFSAHGN